MTDQQQRDTIKMPSAPGPWFSCRRNERSRVWEIVHVATGDLAVTVHAKGWADSIVEWMNSLELTLPEQ